MSLLTDFVDQCLSVAEGRGLDASTPVIVKVRVEGEDTEQSRVVCAYSEPHDTVLPLNVSWIIADPASPDYRQVMQRSSKTASAPYVHTWSQVTNYEDIFVPQFYDVDDQQLIGASVDEMEKHIQEGPAEDPHDMTTYVDGKIGNLGRSFSNMFNNLNARVINNDARIRALEQWQQGIDSLTLGDVLEAHEKRIAALENSASYSAVVLSHTQPADDPQALWTIDHDTGLTNGAVAVLNDANEVIVPADINFHDGTVVVSFSSPTSGKCFIIGA